jgi:hypothetical protein
MSVRVLLPILFLVSCQFSANDPKFLLENNVATAPVDPVVAFDALSKAKTDTGVKSFNQLLALYSRLTGVKSSHPAITGPNGVYTSIITQLAKNSDLESSNGFTSNAAMKLAGVYCENYQSQVGSPINGAASMTDLQIRQVLINSLLDPSEFSASEITSIENVLVSLQNEPGLVAGNAGQQKARRAVLGCVLLLTSALVTVI